MPLNKFEFAPWDVENAPWDVKKCHESKFCPHPNYENEFIWFIYALFSWQSYYYAVIGFESNLNLIWILSDIYHLYLIADMQNRS